MECTQRHSERTLKIAEWIGYETENNTGCDGGRLRLALAQFFLLRGSFSRSAHGRLLVFLRRISAALDRRRRRIGEKIWSRSQSDLCRENPPAAVACDRRSAICHGHRNRRSHIAYSRGQGSSDHHDQSTGSIRRFSAVPKLKAPRNCAAK